MRSVLFVSSYVLVALVVSPTFAATLLVPSQYLTIAAALSAANDDDVILISDGTYTGLGNRDLDFPCKRITVRSASDNPYECVIDCGGSLANPHRGFSFRNDVPMEAVLRGITITNGYAQLGGAIFGTGTGRPLITNCIFHHNAADSGGAVFCDDGFSPEFNNCTFCQNTADCGGGACCNMITGSPLFLSCRFNQNVAEFNGGGLWLDNFWDLIYDSKFTENTANWGAGLYCLNCNFHLCTCELSWNEAINDGGGLYCKNSTLVICHDIFTANCSWNSPPLGSSVYALASNLTHTNCTYTNDLKCRGKIVGYAPTSDLASTGREDPGSVIHVEGPGGSTMEKAIIAFAADGMVPISCANSGTAELFCCDLYGNSGGDWVGCVAGQLGLDNNFSADPRFCDMTGGDYMLDATSPCLPAYSPCGELVGFLGEGCTLTAAREGQVEPQTWARVKARYR